MGANGNPPAPGETYATALAIPRHLLPEAMANQELIGKVSIDAYNFIFDRCNKSLGLASIVASAVATLTAEYEKGEFTKEEDFDSESLARKNYEAEHPRATERGKQAEEIIERLGLARVQTVAAAIYAANVRIHPVSSDGTPFPRSIWDEKVLPETKLEFVWAAAVALDADAKALADK
jgi:hypothetical protein